MSDPKDPTRAEYASGVLDPDAHHRIVADIDKIARAANIPTRAIHTGIGECRPLVARYLERFADLVQTDLAGLVLVGAFDSITIEKEISLIAGAFVRNFIGARVITMQNLLRDCEEGEDPQERVILIPDFYIDDVKIPSWKLANIRSCFIDRMYADQQTILGVQNFEHMRRDYGATFTDFIIEHFKIEDRADA